MSYFRKSNSLQLFPVKEYDIISVSVFFAFIILTHYTHLHVHSYFLFIVFVIFHIYFKDGFVYDCADSFLLLFTL